jgi:hypothetical protein
LIIDLSKNKNDALEKLDLVKDALQNAKRASKNDIGLEHKIKEIEDGANPTENEIVGLDRKIDDLKRRKNE